MAQVPTDELEPLYTAETRVSSSLRQINLILDHTAFVKGIGNVKRWFNDEYVSKNFKSNSDKLHLNLFIPTYTLHEFDYAKRGHSMLATNAREAVKFIDQMFETEFNENGPIQYNVAVETPEDGRVSWNQCLTYQAHVPRVREFPNFNTRLESNVLGGPTATRTQEPFDENQPAELPYRLKHLLRTCIQKRFVENTTNKNKLLEQWKVVTEDAVTKIWLTSFGIDCLNVNEAELLIFGNHDVNTLQLHDPRFNFAATDSFTDEPEGGILHSKVDTTQYSYYASKKNSKKKSENKKQHEKKSEVQGVIDQAGGVKHERFDAINFAPRGQGQLWTPNKGNRKEEEKRRKN